MEEITLKLETHWKQHCHRIMKCVMAAVMSWIMAAFFIYCGIGHKIAGYC